MDDTLKIRLIGAIVLVALGVIFIPALLDGTGYTTRQARSIEIPPKPVLSSTKQDKLEPVPTPIDPEPEKPAATQQKEKKKEASEPVKAWALQVSTSSLRESAYALRDRLRDKGYNAYISTEKNDGESSYRVRIGPELDRKSVDALHDRVKKEQGLDGFVVNHP